MLINKEKIAIIGIENWQIKFNLFLVNKVKIFYYLNG